MERWREWKGWSEEGGNNLEDWRMEKEYGRKEKQRALEKLGRNPEITRFKGLGEISPDEFKFMIGPDMRLDPVEYEEGKGVRELLAFYMGKNTPERQGYIINNLREDVDRQVA